MSRREFRYEPHFIRAGQSNRYLANRSCIAQFVGSADGAGGLRLRVFDSSASNVLNATNDERIVLRCKNGESISSLGAALQFSTGLCCSLSGTGAVLTAFIRQIL